MVQELTADNFRKEVLESAVPVLVDFWSPTCAPCRRIAPVLDEVAGEAGGHFRVGKVNAWDEPMDFVLAESFARRAATREARREPIPKVAASERNAKEWELYVRKRFLAEYRVALRAWCAGDRAVVFPYGTWWMRVHHGVEVAEPPSWAA